MLEIARDLDKALGIPVYKGILSDIGNYAYPILSIQADRQSRIFVRYLLELARIGLGRVPMFYIYALGLLIFGRKRCDTLISRLKRRLGQAPRIGKVYAGRELQ
jgi:hypothetical protein